MKLCIDCKHCDEDDQNNPQCTNDDIDLVDGSPRRPIDGHYCTCQRYPGTDSFDYCGREGKHWEAKTIKPEPPGGVHATIPQAQTARDKIYTRSPN
jgi:hypothetical protein